MQGEILPSPKSRVQGIALSCPKLKCIYTARKRAGLTQAKVATMVGVSARWYQRTEKGEKLPGTVVAIKFMLLFGMDVEDFRGYFEM